MATDQVVRSLKSTETCSVHVWLAVVTACLTKRRSQRRSGTETPVPPGTIRTIALVPAVLRTFWSLVNTASHFGMRRDAVEIGAAARVVVGRTAAEVCAHRGWALHAAHVGVSHVHLVMSGQVPPEAMLTSIKAWTTRRLVEAGLLPRGTKPWARHGSTVYLWTGDELGRARLYVTEGQGADADLPCLGTDPLADARGMVGDGGSPASRV